MSTPLVLLELLRNVLCLPTPGAAPSLAGDAPSPTLATDLEDLGDLGDLGVVEPGESPEEP